MKTACWGVMVFSVFLVSSRGEAQEFGGQFKGNPPGDIAGRTGIGVSSAPFSMLWVDVDNDSMPTAERLFPMVNLSAKYFLDDKLAMEALFGFSYISGEQEAGPGNEVDFSSFLFSLGPRALFSFFEAKRSHLYAGGGFQLLIGGVDVEGDETDVWGLHLSLPLGFEYMFESIPNLALGAEVSLNLIYLSINPEGDNNDFTAFNFLVGYPGGSTLPGLDFLTLNVHYYF